jgi:hypothetical protein
VGVSGLQATGHTSVGIVVCPRSEMGGLLAVPSRRYPYPRPASGRPVLFVPRGVRRGVSGVRGSVSSAFSSQHAPTRFEHVAFTDWSFGYCLTAGGGQAASAGRLLAHCANLQNPVKVMLTFPSHTGCRMKTCALSGGFSAETEGCVAAGENSGNPVCEVAGDSHHKLSDVVI